MICVKHSHADWNAVDGEALCGTGRNDCVFGNVHTQIQEGLPDGNLQK